MDFCPRCGKKNSGDICSKCAKEIALADKEFKDINITICGYCSSFFVKNKWKEFEKIEDVVIDCAAKATGIDKNKIHPIIPDKSLNPGMNVEIEVGIDVSDKEVYRVPAKIEVTLCPKCSKRDSQYFEGILQLRNPKKDIIDFVYTDIEKNSKNGVFITDEKKLKNGIDLYITSQKYMQQFGKRLQNNFSGRLELNYKLFTRRDNKDVYRVNMLFDAADFRKGDVIQADGKVINVTNTGKKISGINLETGKRISIDYKGAKISKLEVIGTTVSKIYPEIEVLHPETYQPIKVINKKNVKNGEKVKICILNDKIYIV